MRWCSILYLLAWNITAGLDNKVSVISPAMWAIAVSFVSPSPDLILYSQPVKSRLFVLGAANQDLRRRIP